MKKSWPLPKGRLVFAMLALALLPSFGLLSKSVSAQTADQSRAWPTGAVLDQMDTPECVGYATEAWLQSGPYPYPVLKIPSADEIYIEAQLYDEWPGNSYNGTSANGAMNYLLKEGYIDSYRDTESVKELRDFILHSGPVIMSTAWMSGMFSMYGGYVYPSGQEVSYHAWMCYGFDVANDAFECQNSYNGEYASGGKFKIKLGSVAYLLNKYGGYGTMPQKDIWHFLLNS